ncbi:hypothetical protein vseg_017099 [Gypsophila vaccaria]
MDAVEKPNKGVTTDFSDWITTAVVGTVGGALIGGVLGAGASTDGYAKIIDNLRFGKTAEKWLGYPLSRATRGSINVGVLCGTCFAIHNGVHNWVAEKRGVHDLYNTVVAGFAGCCVMGLMGTPAGRSWSVRRARNLVAGSLLGTFFFIPLGVIHMKVLEKSKENKAPRAAANDI